MLDLQLTARNQQFKDILIDTLPNLCSEKANIWTEVFQNHEELLPITKAALALEETLKRMTIRIEDYELIVGNQGNGLRAATFHPIVNTWYVEELDKFEKRDGSKFTITEKVKEDVRTWTPYWKGRNVYDKTRALLEDDTIDAMDALVFTCGYTLTKGCGHWLVNFETVLNGGFRSVEEKAKAELARIDYSKADGVDKIPFLKAIVKTCQAVKMFAERYAVLALKQAETAEPERRAELLEIARICQKVPYEKADTFREAVQTVFFIQLITQIESDGTGISLGRLDYILYPYYKKDLEEGRITVNDAKELVDHLWLKISSIIQIWNEADTKSFGGHPISQAITLGGQDADGRDATNDLSYIMLEATARTHMAQPSLCCRIHRNTPKEFLLKCTEVIREGVGMPAMYNDDIAIPSLVSRGIPVAVAREYYGVIGCVEMGIQGKLCAFANSGYFNIAKALEIALHGGVDPATGKKLAKCGTDVTAYETYEAFEGYFFEVMDELLKHQVIVTNVVDTMHPRVAPLPFMSAITDDCVSRGKEVQSGGAIFNWEGIQGVGFADVIDSFAVIKKLVYEEKQYTMADIITAIDANFEGCHELIKDIRKSIVKYGNNDPETNEIARVLAKTFSNFVESYENTRGGFYIPGMYSNSANVPLGEVVGALPNGRRANLPIAEACSPTHGSEKSGPTQAALSVAYLDHMIMTNGSQYNQKYHPSALAGEKGLEALSDLIRTYFEAGGYHIQFNVVSSEKLREAQKNPEKYKDLVVRVAGYTAFFIDLNKEIQDDIIDRTELGF